MVQVQRVEQERSVRLVRQEELGEPELSVKPDLLVVLVEPELRAGQVEPDRLVRLVRLEGQVEQEQ